MIVELSVQPLGKIDDKAIISCKVKGNRRGRYRACIPWAVPSSHIAYDGSMSVLMMRTFILYDNSQSFLNMLIS